MAELNLSISIMPAKHVVTLSVLMTDTIAEMKSKLSVSSTILLEIVEAHRLSRRINENREWGKTLRRQLHHRGNRS